MEIAHPCNLKILCDKLFRPWGISMKAKFFLFLLLCIKAATIPLHRYDTEKIRMQCKFKEFFAHPMPLKCISGLFSFLLFFIRFFYQVRSTYHMLNPTLNDINQWLRTSGPLQYANSSSEKKRNPKGMENLQIFPPFSHLIIQILLTYTSSF